MEDGHSIAMNELRVGDMIKVYDLASGEYRFSPVLGFLHVERDREQEYLLMKLQNQASITMSGDHLLFVNETKIPIRAKSAIVGRDTVWYDNALVLITDRVLVKKHGVFNVLTYEGTIVVDGVLASNYASDIYSHEVQHQVLSPFRLFSAYVYLFNRGQLPENGVLPYASFLQQLESILIGLSQFLPCNPRQLFSSRSGDNE